MPGKAMKKKNKKIKKNKRKRMWVLESDCLLLTIDSTAVWLWGRAI